MINYNKFSYIFVGFGIFLMIKVNSAELLFEHAISFFLEILSFKKH